MSIEGFGTASGIHITSIKHPANGAVVMMHCKGCKETVIAFDKWAIKPRDGDLWYIEIYGCTTCNKVLMPKEMSLELIDYLKSRQLTQRLVESWLTTNISL